MKLIINFPVTVRDIETTEYIWRKHIGTRKVKTVRKIPTQVKMEFVEVPKLLLKLHNKLFIGFDVIFINIMPCMVSLLRNIIF